MAIKRPASALLSKYLQLYKRQPGSRVFAPLAESYRKLGMYDEALKILKEGIKRHPTYVLGYLVLAQCYHDQNKNEAAYQTLLPLAAHNKDNPGLQKLFAQVCLQLGNLDEALQTFKYLLFLNPRDKYYAQQVKALEDDLLKKNNIKPQSIIVKSPQAQKFDSSDDDWSMVNFAPDKTSLSEEPLQEDQWTMAAPPESSKTLSSNENDWKIMSRSIDDDFFSDEEISPEDSDAPTTENSIPLASHTLVDLYLAQNHIGPAIDLLENIIALNPSDKRSKKKLAELKIKSNVEHVAQKMTSALDGHEELMRIIESEVQAPQAVKMERALKLFLQQIQLTADEKRSSHG